MTILSPSVRARLLAEYDRRGLRNPVIDASRPKPPAKPLPGAELPWRDWLATYYPHVASAPMAERHIRLWDWFDALTPGTRPKPRIECWARGGAKSSTGELGITRLCDRLTRRFALYVSGTQDQADKHVQAVATLMEHRGFARSLNTYGSSRGWRRQELRTANGFNVSAFGLDAAGRGVKMDQYRPDLIIFDDVDNQADTIATVRKKIEALTTSVIPAGSEDVAILFLQNMIWSESIMAQVCSNRADFLLDREPPCIEPAVRDLVLEIEHKDAGPNTWRIVSGTPTWEGQSLAICEQQINAWGKGAFLREAQHEVEGADGVFFKVRQISCVEPFEVPALVRVSLSCDLAATEGGGDHTVLALYGLTASGSRYILAVIRGQWGSERVRGLIRLAAGYYKRLYPMLTLHLPQDPGQAGKDQAASFRAAFAEFKPKIEPVSGNKATRATSFQEQVNLGNVHFVNADLPDIFREFCGTLLYWDWQSAAREELRTFEAPKPGFPMTDQVDDQVDALADCETEVSGGKRMRML